LNAGFRMGIDREGNRIDFVLDEIELAINAIRVQGQIHIDDILAPNSLVRADIQIDPFKVSDLLPVLEWVPGSRDTTNEQIKLKGKIEKVSLKFETPI